MKCEYCGHSLNIEDKFCPACGRPNPLAVQHQKDMEQYKNKYEETKREVITKTRRAAGINVPIAVLAVLLVLCIAAVIFRISAWDIGYNMRSKNIGQKSAEYKAQIDEYLEDGDYIAFASYWRSKDLYMLDEFRDYSAVESAANYYKRLFEELTYDRYNKYSRRESTIVSVCDSIIDLFGVESNYLYDKDTALAPDKMEHIQAIQEKSIRLTAAFTGITYDEAKALTEMSEPKMRAFLTERWAEDEE